MCPSASPSSPSPLLLFLLPLRVFSPSCPLPSVPCSCSCSPLRVAPPPSPSPCLLPRTFHSRAAASPDVPVRGTGRTPGLFAVFPLLPWTLQSLAPGSPPDDPVRGLGPCFIPPRMLQSGASFCLLLSVASDAPSHGTGFTHEDPVRGLVPCFVPSRMLHSGAPFNRILSFALDAPVRSTGFSPGQSSPGARVVPHSALDAPLLGVFLSYSLRCLGRSSPWRRVHPRTIQSGGLCRASFRPGCSNPGRHFVVLSPLPRTLQSVAPGSPPDDPVRGLAPCFMPPRMLRSGASFYRILSVAPDATVRGTGFTPGRSSPGASAVPLSALGAPILAVFLSYSLRCLGRSSPETGFTPGRSSPGASAVLLSAPDAPNRAVVLSYSLRCLGRSSPGGLFIVFPPLPRTLQSAAAGSPPDDPVRGLAPCFIPPRMLQSGASFCHILSAGSDAPVRVTGFTPGPSSPGASAVLFPRRMLRSGACFYRILSVASDAPVRGTVFTPGRSSPGASAVLHSSPVAPIRGVFLSYSLRRLGRSSPWRRVHPRTIQSGGLSLCFIPPR